MLSRQKKRFLAAFAGILAACQTLTLFPTLALGTPDVQSSVMTQLVNETSTELASGIKEKHLTYIDNEGYRTEALSVDVDLSNKNASIVTGTPNDGTGYAMQTVRSQANSAIKNGKQVVAAVNGDYYNMATGEPLGMELKDGVEIKDNTNWNFFGIQKDGTPVIGTSALYEQIKGNLQQAVGGPRILVKDGQVVEYADDTRYPCAAVGIRADNTVFFVVVDGKQAPYSNGITEKNLSQLLINMGAQQGLMLDGGGSATYVSKTPGDDALTCKNSPSDGQEREVGNSLLIISKTASDHQFASAYISPYDTTFSPNSTINFAAKGVDAAGYSASLPGSGLTWSISDTSFGTIDATTGVFQSNGKTGQFQAQLNYGGKVVGSTYVEIAIPDDIHFVQPELSLKFDVDQDLGLIARYQGRDVTLHAGDIQWTFDSSLGTMGENNILHTAASSASGPMVAKFTGTDLSSTLNVQVGQLPVVLYNFEDGLSDWSASTAGRGEKSSISLASYPNDPVRFDQNSLKIDFDLTNAQTGTTLGAYAGPAESKDIPGMPTAVGMWVYATPEAQGFWLRMYVYDKAGVVKPIDLTPQTPGINWVGWKYCEAQIPSSYQGPFKTVSKQMVRLMSLKSGMAGGGPMTKGSIYVDNIRAVYGANVDDLYSPIIDSVSVENKTYTTSGVDISATIHDDTTDKYMSGINWDRVHILVDGKDYTTSQGHFSYDMDGSVHLSGLRWADGVHKATVDIQDNFGNETSKDYYFTVKTGSGTGLSFTPQGASAPLGGSYQFKLTADDLSNVTGANAVVNIGKGFPVTGVDFAASAAGSTYDYDAASGNLTLDIKNSGGAKGAGTLATVTVSVPAGTAQGGSIAYSITSGSAAFSAAQGENFVGTFSGAPGTVPVAAALNVSLGQMVVGADGKVAVTTADGKLAAGAEVMFTPAGGTAQSLGATDADGNLASPVPTQTAQKFTLSAQLGTDYSFPTAGQSFTPQKDAAPSNLLAGATQDPSTEKTITWMTNPLQGKDQAIMQVAKTDDYSAQGDAAFSNAAGTRQLVTYSADGSAVTLNSVTATGLVPETSYSYRVGDGETWSDVRTFKTLKADDDHLTFNVFGDTQVTDASGLNDFSSFLTNIENAAQKSDFAIHVGDFTDDQTVFKEMDITASMFSQHSLFDSLDTIHVLGNHEYMGDNGSKSASILGMPNTNGPAVDKTGTYSVDYGNMHIAVLGWTDNADELQQKLDWLRQDMKATKKTWKIIATHQPAFNKNPDDGSTLFYNMLPKVCDELGIDLVFNGHDHSYGRTYPIYDGKPVTSDPTDCNKGTIYIATGHTGDKTYDINPAQPEAFATTQQEANKDDKVYLTFTVSGSQMHLVLKDSMNGATTDDVTLTAHAADKAALQSAITSAQGLRDVAVAGDHEDNYPQSAIDTLQSAIDTANAVNSDAGATPDDVDAAAAALDTAVSAFQASVVTVDRTALNALIAAVCGLTDSSQYTQSSWNALQTAWNAAKTVQSGKPSQQEINDAYSALLSAKNSLVPNSGSSGGSSSDGSGGSGQTVTLPDSKTGVRITAAQGLLPDDAALNVRQVTTGTDYQKAENALTDVGARFVLYDISVLIQNGKVKWEPGNGKTVQVSLPIPDGFDKSRLAVYYIADDGSKERIPGKVEGSNYVFDASHFSQYALVEQDAASSASPSGSASDASAANPNTGADDASPVGALVLFAGAAACAVLVLRRRRK